MYFTFGGGVKIKFKTNARREIKLVSSFNFFMYTSLSVLKLTVKDTIEEDNDVASSLVLFDSMFSVSLLVPVVL